MNGVNTSDAVTGLFMCIAWLFWLWIAVFNPEWYHSLFLSLYSILVGSYINDMGTKYKIKDVII